MLCVTFKSFGALSNAILNAWVRHSSRLWHNVTYDDAASIDVNRDVTHAPDVRTRRMRVTHAAWD